MQKAYNKKTISLKEQLHELEEVLNNADPVLDKDLIISKKNEVLCLVMSYKDYLSRRIKLPKGVSGSYSVEDAFSEFMIYFIEWLNKQYSVKETGDSFKQKSTQNNSGDHIFAIVMKMSPVRGLDVVRKIHPEKNTSLEAWVTDVNGNESDHSELLTAGDEYRTEDSLMEKNKQNSLPDGFFIDLLSEILESYKNIGRYKKLPKKLNMYRIFFSRDVMAYMHVCDIMPEFEHSREIGNNTIESFVNYCLQKHVSYEEEGRFVLPGMYNNPYKPYLDLICAETRKKIVDMEKSGIPDTVIKGYFYNCCNVNYGSSKLPFKNDYVELRVEKLDKAIPKWRSFIKEDKKDKEGKKGKGDK